MVVDERIRDSTFLVLLFRYIIFIFCARPDAIMRTVERTITSLTPSPYPNITSSRTLDLWIFIFVFVFRSIDCQMPNWDRRLVSKRFYHQSCRANWLHVSLKHNDIKTNRVLDIKRNNNKIEWCFFFSRTVWWHSFRIHALCSFIEREQQRRWDDRRAVVTIRARNFTLHCTHKP